MLVNASNIKQCTVYATPLSQVLLENLIATYIVMKFRAFYWPWKFILFTTARVGPHPLICESIPYHPILFFKHQYYYIPHLRLSGSFLKELLPTPLFSHAIIFTDFNPNMMWSAVQITTIFLNIKLVAWCIKPGLVSIFEDACPNCL
jgi:hypothetical protein